MKKAILVSFLAGAISSPAFASTISITQGSSAPTYSTTLNFDETGGPTGPIAPDSFAGLGLAQLSAGDGTAVVDSWGDVTNQPWLGDGNSLLGNFGLFFTFSEAVSAMSFQAWDASGAPSPFGGGFGVFAFNDGVEVASFVGAPAFDGVGDEWYDIVATGGVVFDEVRLVGFGFATETFVDNMSWDVAPIPVPGALLLFTSSLFGLGLAKRRSTALRS